NLSSLRSVTSGGSSVHAGLIRDVCQTFNCNFSTNFGQTELCGVISQTFPDDEPELHANTIGQPSLCMEVKIAEPDTGGILPIGEPGEIWARGYQVMSGYFNVQDGAQSAITSDGWLKTGDLASMDRHGYLRITGRLKDAII